ncbi:uncharacterized protein LOC130137667 [Syzygium oleosum]|uniref:uncharacterized protein LOC130137667 n=1 Tax=Syzygium oleosum TaxID=219896 RepID=UPI0024B8E1FC|nr:uncharacterized protein LOC130137667 [Syzygium oleosum]
MIGAAALTLPKGGGVGNTWRYGDYSGNKDWRKSGGDNCRGEKDEFNYKKEIALMVPTVIDGYVASRPGHGTGSLSKPTNNYPRQHQAGTIYMESVSTAYHYPETMLHTMDATKRYGNINLGSCTKLGGIITDVHHRKSECKICRLKLMPFHHVICWIRLFGIEVMYEELYTACSDLSYCRIEGLLYQINDSLSILRVSKEVLSLFLLVNPLQ